MRAIFIFVLLLSLFSSSLCDTTSSPPPPATEKEAQSLESILSTAGILSNTGAYSDAIRLYSEALQLQEVEASSSDQIKIKFKRSIAYVAIGRTSQALNDLNSILEINSDFHQAKLQISRLMLKEGNFQEASVTLDAYSKSNPSDTASISEVKASIDTAKSSLTLAQKAVAAGDLQKAIDLSSDALVLSPNALVLRDLRLDALIQLGRYEEAITDLRRLSNLQPSDASLHMRLSHLQYVILDNFDTAIATLKQCLHYDPENPKCHKAFKAFKALHKDVTKARNFSNDSKWSVVIGILLNKKDGLLSKVDTLLENSSLYIPKKSTSGLKVSVISLACRALTANTDRRASGMCAETLRLDPENPEGLIGLSDDLMKDEEYQEAVRVLQKCWEGRGRNRADVREKFQKAERLLKISQSKDYYKILGVPRDATSRQIKKAFRKTAKESHPDKGGSQAKMQALNEAFEVLSDPEKRAVFDSGVDPNSHEYLQQQQQQQQHHGFQGFQGHPFFQQGGFSQQNFWN